MPDSKQKKSRNSTQTLEPIAHEPENWPLQQSYHVQDIPPSGKHMVIKASSEECVALADYLDVPKVASMTAEIHLKPYASGDVRVTGDIHVDLTYECGASLQPYDDAIDCTVDVQYVDPERRKDILRKWDFDDVSNLDRDVPDALINGLVPLGAVLSEHIALNRTAFPRKAGAEFAEPAPVTEDELKPVSPFAALKDLKA